MDIELTSYRQNAIMETVYKHKKQTMVFCFKPSVTLKFQFIHSKGIEALF